MRRSLGVKCFLASGKELSGNHHPRSYRLREPADNANFTLSQLLMGPLRLAPDRGVKVRRG
jgi:hypothetical protein